MLSNEPLVGMEGEKQVLIEERMKLSSSRMCSQKEFQVLRNRVPSSQEQSSILPPHPKEPLSGRACLSRKRTLFNKHILTMSPRVVFFSLNGVKLFLNLKEHDSEGDMSL